MSNINNKDKSSNQRSSHKALFSILGILTITSSLFGGYLYFRDNLGSDNTDNQALAASTPATAFNPSDCGTYLSNGGSSNNGVCYVKMYEKGGVLYRNLDIAPGELVNVRNYYNNTNTSSVTAANITDSIPTNFTRVGTVTNTYVDATPVTLNNNVFTGQNLSVAPGAGYFGYAGDNTLTSSNLELGRARYITQFSCAPTTPAIRIYSLRGLTTTDQSAMFNGATDAECETIVTGQGTPWQTNSGGTTAQSYILAGQRYLTQISCSPNAPSARVYRLRGTGNIDQSNAGVADAECETIVTGQGTPWQTNSGGPTSTSFDMLGQRYLTQISCVPNTPAFRFYKLRGVGNAVQTNGGVADAECETFVSGQGFSWQSNSGGPTSTSFDTSDPTRGHGYISYTMQTPTTGLTNGQTFGTSSSMVGTNGNVQTFTSDKTGSLTVINANSANIISGIIPNDCTTYPGGTTASETNGDGTACVAKTYVKNGIEYTNMEVAPGETVTVRLRYNNSATTSADQIRLRDNIPTGWTLTGNATAKYVDSIPVSLGTAASIFNSPDDTGLDVAPHIGFFGANSSTPATDAASLLELGKKRYIGATFCQSVSYTNTTVALTGPSNTPPTPSCVNVLPTNVGNFYGTSTYDFLGNRYIPAAWCSAVPSGPEGGLGFSLGNPRNTPDAGNCFNVGLNTYWTAAFDLLGKRFLPYYVCQQTVPVITNFTYVGTPSATNTPASSCADIYTQSVGGFNYIDLSDQNRAHGYLEYQMTSPSNLTTGTVSGNPSVILEDNDNDNWNDVNNPTGSANLIGVTTPAPNMNYTKLYSVDGGSTWSPTVSASTGQPIKVRLWNENTGGLSVTNGNIKDTIPAGFNYTSGSAKNCLNPSTILPTTPDNTELICDTGNTTNKDLLFSTLTSTNGVSPSAGLYDATGTSVASGGTSFNAVAGAKEIGKVKYITQISCVPTTPPARFYRLRGVGNVDQTQNPNGATNAECEGFVSGSGSAWQTNSGGTTANSINMLGQRYLNQISCVPTPLGARTFKLRGATNVNQSATSNGATNAECETFWTGSGTNWQANVTTADGFDLLDASRSKSYIEYEMSAGSSVISGTYGTISTISSTATNPEFTSINSGSNSDITITQDPAFNIKKLLALPTSGTGSSAVCPTDASSYTSTLSGVDAGATVCVRLAYQNKTSGAVSNAAITDTLTSGFTYIDTSTTNCLTPTTGSPVCANDTTQANTAWNGNNGWTGNNFALAPHSGLYGQAASGTGSTASVMEMGRASFLVMSHCNWSSASSADSIYLNYFYPRSAGTEGVETSNNYCNTNPVSGYTLGGGNGNHYRSISGKRYYHYYYCNYNNTVNGDSKILINGTVATITTTNPLSGSQACATDPGFAMTPTADFKDMLSQRYLYHSVCRYVQTAPAQAFDVYYRSNIAFGNSNPGTNCPNNISGYTLTTPGQTTVDTLDPTNGTGFVQYKVTTPTNPTTQSITLPNVSLSGDNQTTVTSNATINFNSTPLIETDIPNLTVICGTTSGSVTSAPVNDVTTCTFPLPSNKTLPSDFKLSIGNGSIDAGGNTPNQTCTVNAGIVTCTNVPTGNSIGNMPIFGNLGTGGSATKTPTGESVMITGSNFGAINWIFNPDQGGTSPLFRSSDNTSITVNNFRTIFDPTPNSNTRYTCTLEYRNLNDRLTSTPTWTALNTTPIPYTTETETNSGCTVNLTKQQRGNALNHSLRLTITDTTITNPSSTNPNTYTFYDEYIFRFQGAGVASGG